jgi:hypothetical protein
MKIDGGCHCGYITYEAEADPDDTLICNCTDCQTLSGSAFRTVAPTKSGSFRLLSGEPKIYVKIAESGTARPQAFCPQCGAPIYSSVIGDGPKVHFLRVGTIRQREQFVPTKQFWARSALEWVGGLAAIPRIDTQPTFSPSGSLR